MLMIFSCICSVSRLYILRGRRYLERSCFGWYRLVQNFFMDERRYEDSVSHETIYVLQKIWTKIGMNKVLSTRSVSRLYILNGRRSFERSWFELEFKKNLHLNDDMIFCCHMLFVPKMFNFNWEGSILLCFIRKHTESNEGFRKCFDRWCSESKTFFEVIPKRNCSIKKLPEFFSYLKS